MAKKLILQIYNGEVPLTQIETARVIQTLQEQHIIETANQVFSAESTLPKRCDNKNHNLYRKCVGGGVCLAKKYKKGTTIVDQICSGCDSKVITETLNYIFDNYYTEPYRAEWRTPRKTKRSNVERKTTRPKKNTKEDQVALLNDMDPKKPSRRKRSIRKERN